LADLALESFGVTVPLLQFHGVHSRCHNSDNSDKGSDEPADEKSYSDDDEDQEAEIEPDDNPLLPVLLSLEKTNGKPVLKSHPYIITR
jgi:hypothetical protein